MGSNPNCFAMLRSSPYVFNILRFLTIYTNNYITLNFFAISFVLLTIHWIKSFNIINKFNTEQSRSDDTEPHNPSKQNNDQF